MKKYIIAIMSILTVSVSLFGCTQNDVSSQTNPTKQTVSADPAESVGYHRTYYTIDTDLDHLLLSTDAVVSGRITNLEIIDPFIDEEPAVVGEKLKFSDAIPVTILTLSVEKSFFGNLKPDEEIKIMMWGN